MLEVEMGRKLVVNARDAVGMATGVVSHLIWFVSYQLDGTTRLQPQPPRAKAKAN